MVDGRSELNGVLSMAYDFGVTGVAAAIAKTFIYPLERISGTLKNQHLMPGNEAVSPWTRVSTLVTNPAWLWRGGVTASLRFSVVSASQMPMKNQYKRMLIDPERPMNIYGVSWYATNIVAGALAGATWIALTYPAHQARMILANDFLQSTRTGEAHRYEKRTLREIVAKDGVQVLYQRFGLACAGVAVYRGLFFGLYDSLKPFARKESFISNFFLGWGTSMSAHIATYPLDILRRYAEKTKSKSAVHAIMAMMRNGELNALFRGVTGGLVRASSGGGVLAGYDLIMSLLFPKY